MLRALRTFFSEYRLKQNGILSRDLPDEWAQIKNSIISTKRLHAGVLNALEDAWNYIESLLGDGHSLEKLKADLDEHFQTFIEEKIVYANQQMVHSGLKLFSTQKEETIMLMGENILFD